ncbi:MAG: alpha-amylase family glycosyl hydrolase [Isosphaeraceae bacterium]
MDLSRNPSLYEIDTRAWLYELSRQAGKPVTLERVPDRELDAIAASGFEWVWLLGVWTTGPAGRAVSLSNPEWIEGYRHVLPDFREEDVAGSTFAIRGYEVSPALGGNAALETIRERLHERGIRLMLDFVPNHTAPDHPWVMTHPEFYVHGTEDDLAREPKNYTRLSTSQGPAVLAFGRDPYFPGWPDTLQLNYRHPSARRAMADELLKISRQGDGVRCDMAMLILPDVFQRTWGDRALPSGSVAPDDSPFWPPAIGRVKAESPEFVFMAEAYWDLEWRLQQEGFDYTYDKRLYDRLRSRDAGQVRGHLHADLGYQRKSARFLENHDEERAAEAFPRDVHEAAAVVTFFTPGLRFFHQGQLEGKAVRPSIHLGRRPDDPGDPELRRFYEALLHALRHVAPRDGDWRLLYCHEAWGGNPTHENFLAFYWQHPTEPHVLVALNYGAIQGQCYVTLPHVDNRPAQVRLRDLLGPSVYDRGGQDLEQGGLFLDMPAWGYHVFTLEPVPVQAGANP